MLDINTYKARPDVHTILIGMREYRTLKDALTHIKDVAANHPSYDSVDWKNHFEALLICYDGGQFEDIGTEVNVIGESEAVADLTKQVTELTAKIKAQTDEIDTLKRNNRSLAMQINKPKGK